MVVIVVVMLKVSMTKNLFLHYSFFCSVFGLFFFLHVRLLSLSLLILIIHKVVSLSSLPPFIVLFFLNLSHKNNKVRERTLTLKLLITLSTYFYLFFSPFITFFYLFLLLLVIFTKLLCEIGPLTLGILKIIICITN